MFAKLRPVLAWLLVIYLIVAASLIMLQKKLIFHPVALPQDYVFHFDIPFQEIKIPVKKDILLSAVLFKAEAPKGIVLFFHGNARNISKYAYKTPDFIKNGYDVLMMDYPTFGKSTGPLVESAIYEDALYMYNLARQRFSPDSIIICGFSLGTGVAAELAAKRDCKRLILEAPYYNMTDMASRFAPIYPMSYMLDYKFPTNQFLQKVTAPITIIHGTEDHTIPIKSGKKLQALLKPGDRFIAIPGADHNNLTNYPLFHESLTTALQ